MKNLLSIIKRGDYVNTDYTGSILTIYLQGSRYYEITLDAHKESGEVEEGTNHSEGTLEIDVSLVVFCDDIKEIYSSIREDYEELNKSIAYNLESEFN
jgi:hypothetical protein